MDLIRIFTELTFARADSPIMTGDRDYDADAFINCGRRYFPEISDDRLRNLFNLFRDKWSMHDGRSNIFNVIRHMASCMLSADGGTPCVSHANLLRWNESSQMLGTEIFVSALLADRNIHHSADHVPDLSWPQVLNSDNPELNTLYKDMGLVELHSHLKASTNVFEISWLCLMNYIKGRRVQFGKVDRAHGAQENSTYGWYLKAVARRLMLFSILIGPRTGLSMEDLGSALRRAEEFGDYSRIDYVLQSLRVDTRTPSKYDYLLNFLKPLDRGPMPMDIFRGERTILYLALRHIFISNDPVVTQLLYDYILAKNHIRQAMIQVNQNMGFGNFARFEGIKEIL